MNPSLDERAVSTAVSHALTLFITAVLVSGLLIAAGQMMGQRREAAVERGLEDVGSAVASDLLRMDQFDTSTVSVSFSSSYPDEIGGEEYFIHVVPDTDVTTIYLNSTATTAHTSVLVRFANVSAVCESLVQGGEVIVAYNATWGSNGCIELREG